MAAGTVETLRAPGPITWLRLEQVFQCDVCKVSLAPTSFKRHKKTVHGDSSSGKQWKCKSCNKSLQTKSRLIHKENYVKENQFSCQECKYSTDNRDYLKDHQRKMHRAKSSLHYMPEKLWSKEKFATPPESSPQSIRRRRRKHSKKYR